MSFINPLLLIGIIAAGIPLIIHLWSKRQARLVDFSYVQFLMSLHRKKIMRLKLKQILILILRMLIVAFIAIALARPVISSKWALAASRAKSSVVIILDNSYSMSYEDFKGKRFDIAKNKAISFLDSLRPGDNASLILMSDHPEVVFKKLTSDIQQVRNSIKMAQVSHRGTYVWSAMSEAHNLLKESDHPHKVIYLISDLGENGWRDWKDLSEDIIDIYVTRIGESESENLNVESISLSSDPVVTGVPLQISAKIAGNSISSDVSSDAVVELFIDGKKRGQAIADIKKPVTFNYIFNNSGFHVGEIRLTSDKLPLDDVRYFAVDVLGQIKVLTAGDNKVYVNLALNPVTPLNPDAEYSIIPTGSSVIELERISPSQYDVIILVDLPELSDKVVRNLENFALSGGNIIIFLGSSVNRNWYNTRFSIMPVKLGDRIDYSKKPLRLNKWNINHPIFRIFADADNGKDASDNLKSFEFYSAFSMSPDATVKVLASFDKDIPAIMEVEAGRGKIILFNFAPDPGVSDLPLKPGFLPIMQQTIFHLISGRGSDKAQNNILVGETYTQYITGRIESPIIFDPGNNSFMPVVKGNKVQYGPLEISGVYRLEFKSEDGIRQSNFAVNLDTFGESLLKSAKDSEVKDNLGKGTRFLSLDESPEEAIGAAKTESELSSRLLIAAALLMLVEIPLANRRKV